MTDAAVSATGLVRQFSDWGVLDWADVHPARQFCLLFGEKDPRVELAAALVVRALRAGSLCIDLARVSSDYATWGTRDDATSDQATVPADAWPEASGWLDVVRQSPAVTSTESASVSGPRPLRLVDGLLYLERYWADQEVVRRGVLWLIKQSVARWTEPGAQQPRSSTPGQDAAVASALSSGLTLIAGGPGTGKTHVIARIVAAASDQGLVGLAAPTGKAAARMTESLRAAAPGLPAASTLHRLLGWKPGSRTRFRHDESNPLPHDMVVVDELSMVSMTMMARLVAALKPGARLVAVGDPDQLSSVEAGAVCADLTGASRLGRSVVRLTHNFRFGSGIEALATAIRCGDADAALALLADGTGGVRLIDSRDSDTVLRARCVDAGRRLFDAAQSGDSAAALDALDNHRLLCAHRRGPYGVQWWTRTVTGWLGEDVPGFATDTEFHVGRPVLMTRNATDLGLFNGDTGVVLAGDPSAVVFATGVGPQRFSPYQVDGLTSVYAMTVHKSQGSQFRRVSLVLPLADSPLLSRELLYTAVTRASDDVVIVGTAEAVRAAITRRSARTSGLADRLEVGQEGS